MNNNLNKPGTSKSKKVEPVKKIKYIEKVEQYLKGKEKKRVYKYIKLRQLVMCGTICWFNT
jgi:hypothetical protein